MDSKQRLLTLLNMYKVIFSITSINGFSYNRMQCTTRGSSVKIFLPFCRLNVCKSFSLLRYISFWNTLKPSPSDVISVAAFRRFLNGSLPETQA